MTNILTLRLDDVSQALFERLRKQHFPPARNIVPAHLSLFHQLPDTPEIEAELDRAARACSAFPLEITGVRSLGRGVAYRIRSAELEALHRSLSAVFAEHLIPQDRQPFHPHIVVQNKATPESARALLAALEQGFQPFAAHVTGLLLWRYLGGPWELAREFPFSG